MRSLICAITAMAVVTASCSSMQKVPVVRSSDGQTIGWQVKAGDTIRVTLRDGGSSQFEVKTVTPEAIIAADGTRFEQASITSVERRGFSSGKTAGAVAGGIGVAAILFLAAAVASLALLFGGGVT